ncbi:MAG: alpha/beta hydrolase [Myxococcales bacterium]|nr:alpha/beta hydrolase [Myxococcales bacterium]MDH3483210.1 alpha/beta hydrolase [Myxococcales bacterium]
MDSDKPKPRGEQLFLDLEGRGRIRVVEFKGPEGAPSLILLHGLAATGPLNWFTAFSDLAERYHVVAVDHRGHGQGIRTRRFRLKDCADDVIGVANELGIRRFIAVGYSMGGPIAKLCWSRQPENVRGLVLCATARYFTPPQFPILTRAILPGAVVGARLAPKLVLGQIIENMVKTVPTQEGRDYVRREMSGCDPAALAQATRAIIRFSSRNWVSNITVPTAVVITTRDEIVPARRQYALARAIPGAKQFEVNGDHFACAVRQTNFVPQLVAACDYVNAEASG